ncbi:TPA: hypothetical protein I7730_20405 [Vibrio vulnificus]|uniref:Secretin N-terminal domain-containing protein n=1 Tax=Vibrio vulnificus TaxID=672 RepID=A0A8H9TH90_VIBVL|nr:secretin N-terminal domain-containing protein [Vibrio vulnificus]HAS8542154.1 hypothetical protein [Vibrio vulnificus]
MRFKKTLLGLAIAPFLSACSNMHSDLYKEVKSENEGTVDKIDELKHQTIGEIRSGVVVNDLFVDTNPVKTLTKESLVLPPHYPAKTEIYFAEMQSELSLIRNLHEHYGISLVIDRKISNSADTEESGFEPTAEIIDNSSMSGNLTPIDLTGVSSGLAQDMGSDMVSGYSEKPSSGMSIGGSEGLIGDDPVAAIDFEGSVVQFMDWLAMERGLSWKYDARRDQFVLFDLDTRIFTLINNLDTYSYSNSITSSNDTSSGSSEGASSSTSSTGQTITVTEDSDHWQSIEDMVNSMLSKNGKATFDQLNGRVVVTDTARSLSDIEEIVELLNDESGIQLALEVNYISVQITDSSKFSMKLDATDVISSALEGTIEFGAVQSGIGNLANLNFSKAGVKAMVGAMSEFGTINKKLTSHIPLMNNVPKLYQKVLEDTYISKVEKQDNDDDSESLIPETAVNKAGITSLWKARIVEDQVLVNGRMSIVDNIDMETAKDMSDMVMPENLSDVQQVDQLIPNGRTRIVSIEEEIKQVAKSEGPLGPDSVPIGGSEESMSVRTISMLMVTPYILRGL